MQLKIARLLNRFLIIMSAVILLIIAGYFVVINRFYHLKLFYTIVSLTVSVILYLAFRWLENKWDKKIITRMVQNGHIALAEIKSTSYVMNMRDSSFIRYSLYEFDAEITTPDQKTFRKTFYEKMSSDTGEIPKGFVYVTYDETKPGQIFVVPNLLISHTPSLMPIAARYESNKKLNIKYLDVFYKKGIVIKTFHETVKTNKTARSR